MKWLSPSVLVLVLAAATASARAVTADQHITAVTVYPDRALVTRGGTVKLDAGVQSVVFDNLPLGLEEDSVRAKAQGKLKILGVEMRRDYKEVEVSTDMKQLQDDISKLDDQVRTLTDEQHDLQERNEFLDRIRNKVTSEATAGGKDQAATVQNIQGLYQLYGTELAKNTTRLREIEFALRDLNKQRADKNNRLSLLRQPAAPNTRSAIVTVEAAEPGDASLQVSYVIGGAGWQPQYDAYADPDTQKVDLTYYGVVRQNTGEDWNGVALTLSSARPNVAARLPELAAWTIDFNAGAVANLDEAKKAQSFQFNAVPKLARQQRAVANAAADAPAPVSAPADGTSLADDQMEVAEIRSLGPAATFVVPAKTTIPNDGQPHRSAISVLGLKGEWTYVAAPKLAPGAFLKTRVTNTSGGPLLGGEINAFLGNNFIGKSSIGLVAANASFDLFLGVDENIKITRTEGVKKQEIGGILSKVRVYKRSFTIEVQNFKTTEAAFKISDQVPVSRNGQISVVINRAEPAFKSRNDDTGELTWEFKLKPNEKRAITVEYEVDAPYAQAVAGV